MVPMKYLDKHKFERPVLEPEVTSSREYES